MHTLTWYIEHHPAINLTFGRTPKFITPPWYGGGGWMEPPLVFLLCCSISKRFYLQWKAFDLLYKMRNILWVMGLLEACDVTNNCLNLKRHLGFYQELEIRLKPREMVVFCAWQWKITHKYALCMIFCWKKLKTTWTFSEKSLDHLLLMTSYLVTTEYWPLLNLTQNARER